MQSLMHLRCLPTINPLSVNLYVFTIRGSLIQSISITPASHNFYIPFLTPL